ncbi:Predicted gene 28729 [Apodemus speciosus]|uniref:Predicted gene 28729 n=1 Tax=Apodemus speciosus TaxID=105296 RepID=A0ABQ0F626_APOSI
MKRSGIKHWKAMPRAKERKQKPKGAAPSVVPILQKFLKTYQKHCTQSRTALCPAIQRDLKSSIDREQILRKFMLVRAGNASASTLPVSLEPLLMTIRDESYTLAKEISIWGLQLTNPEIARLGSKDHASAEAEASWQEGQIQGIRRYWGPQWSRWSGDATAIRGAITLGTDIVSAPVPMKLLRMAGIDDCDTSDRGCTATLGNFAKATFDAISKTYSYLTNDVWRSPAALFLEQKGHTTCPVTTLEIIDCKMDLWSLGRLGKALQFSSLHFLVLDYCKERFGNEELESIFSGLERSQRLQGLSMRYCGLGPQSGPRLGSVISCSSICELRLDGNYLQCSGARALLRPIADYAETQGKDQPTLASPHTGSPPQLPQGEHWAPLPDSSRRFWKKGCTL